MRDAWQKEACQHIRHEQQQKQKEQELLTKLESLMNRFDMTMPLVLPKMSDNGDLCVLTQRLFAADAELKVPPPLSRL